LELWLKGLVFHSSERITPYRKVLGEKRIPEFVPENMSVKDEFVIGLSKIQDFDFRVLAGVIS